MSLLNIESSLCNKMSYDFDSLIAPINSSRGQLVQAKNDFRSTVSSILYSDPYDVQHEASALEGAVAEYYPGNTMDDMEALKRMIDECDYLSSLSPISVILGTAVGIFDRINDLTRGSLIPEFGAAYIGNIINNILNGIDIPGGRNISSVFGRADSLINCLTAACGPGDPYYYTVADDYIVRIGDLYDQLNIVSDPTLPNYTDFDYQQIYDDSGLSPGEQLNVNTALTSVSNMNIGALGSINNTVNTVKDLMKGGFF